MPVTHATNILLQSLRQKGISAGERIRSERELSRYLGWDLQEVRKAINFLVEEGLLFRKRGSGTFVRKLPAASALPGATNGNLIPVADLLAEDKEGKGRGEVTSTVRVGVWTDLFWTAQSHQVFLAALSEIAEEQGHKLGIYSVSTAPEVSLSVEKLRERLEEEDADGFIVPDWCAPKFREALGDSPKPCVFYGGSGMAEAAEPTVFMDVGRGLQRAVQILAASGFKRIALFLLASPSQSLREEKLFYHAALDRYGLDFQLIECSDLSASRSMAAARRLLSHEVAPDAVFVGDDYLLDAFAEVLSERGLKPGRDIGVITLSSRGGHPLHSGEQWSCLEYDSSHLARIAFSRLLDLIGSFEPRALSVALQPAWKPGTTHSKP